MEGIPAGAEDKSNEPRMPVLSNGEMKHSWNMHGKTSYNGSMRRLIAQV